MGSVGERSVTVHNFKDSLALSERYTDAPWWGQVYRKAFPDFVRMATIEGPSPEQRAGIDRRIFLHSGKVLEVDEKVRAQDWPDFLLEYQSAAEYNTPGWIVKPLLCDYIAYAYVPSHTCFLLPVQELQRAWREHGQRWIVKHRRVEAKNEGYTTVSVAVPRDVVWAALKDAMKIVWS